MTARLTMVSAPELDELDGVDTSKRVLVALGEGMGSEIGFSVIFGSPP